MTKYGYLTALKSRKDLKQYGSNALTLFALQLFFDIDDITSIAMDNIVDGPDDGGLDLVFINKSEKYAVIAQEYESGKLEKKAAPSKKAGDLSNGLSVLVKVPIEDVPKRLKSSAEELRAALNNDEIENIHLWFVHNLPGSTNVERQLRVVEHTAQSLLKDYRVKEIKGMEVSANKIEEKYQSVLTPIIVKEKFEISTQDGYLIKGGDWEAYITSVPLMWVYKQFKEHGANLFSANVRDYLGISKRTDKNINMGIQETALKDPGHFWVFNNGVTALVNDFTADKKSFCFNGFSILNGAQTTGAIGNLLKRPNKNAKVQIRFVKCNDKRTVLKIKKYNNSQNKIEAPDYRSNDKIQDRLTKEFKSSDIQYTPRRGGFEDIIKRKSNSLPSVLAGQVLAAFHGRPDVAYHQKTEIWESDSMYSNYFNESLNANHILFTYSLFEAIRRKKLILNGKNKNSTLSKIEEGHLMFFQTRGSIFLMTAAIADCLEIFLDSSIPNKFHLKYKKRATFENYIKYWEPLVDISCNFVSYLQEGFSDGAVREKQAQTAINTFAKFIGATKASNKEIYDKFSRTVR